MKLVYTGMFDAVLVPYESEGQMLAPEVERGVPTEFPDEIAERLLEQVDNWTKAPTKAGRQSDRNAAE